MDIRRHELEVELADVELHIEMLQDRESENGPVVDDGLRAEIYALKDRRDELRQNLKIMELLGPTE